MRALFGLRALTVLAGASLVVSGIWWLLDLSADRHSLRADLARAQRDLSTARASLARAQEAARIHRAHLARAADEARRWSDLSNDLQQMEGRDAPLSPLLAATAQRLYHRP